MFPSSRGAARGTDCIKIGLTQLDRNPGRDRENHPLSTQTLAEARAAVAEGLENGGALNRCAGQQDMGS